VDEIDLPCSGVLHFHPPRGEAVAIGLVEHDAVPRRARLIRRLTSSSSSSRRSSSSGGGHVIVRHGLLPAARCSPPGSRGKGFFEQSSSLQVVVHCSLLFRFLNTDRRPCGCCGGLSRCSLGGCSFGGCNFGPCFFQCQLVRSSSLHVMALHKK